MKGQLRGSFPVSLSLQWHLQTVTSHSAEDTSWRMPWRKISSSSVAKPSLGQCVCCHLCFTWTPTEYVGMDSVFFSPFPIWDWKQVLFPPDDRGLFIPWVHSQWHARQTFLEVILNNFTCFFVYSFCRRTGRCQVLFPSVEGSASFKGDITIGNSYPFSATESFSLICKTISICIRVLQIWISAQNVTKNTFFPLINCPWQ